MLSTLWNDSSQISEWGFSHDLRKNSFNETIQVIRIKVGKEAFYVNTFRSITMDLNIAAIGDEKSTKMKINFWHFSLPFFPDLTCNGNQSVNFNWTIEEASQEANKQ